MLVKPLKESFDSNINPFENLRSNVLEMPNGDILYVAYKDGKMIAGSATNAGIIPEHSMSYNFDKSADVNLQDFYDYILYSDDADFVDKSMTEAFDDLNKKLYEFRLVKKKNDYDEYVVKAYKNGKYDEHATYYTDDWEDAVGTLKDIAARQGLEVTPAYGGKGFVAKNSEKIEEGKFFNKRILKDETDGLAPEKGISNDHAKESVVDLFKAGILSGNYSSIPVGRKNAATVDIDGIDRTRMMAFLDRLPKFKKNVNNDSDIISYEYVSDKLDIEFFDSFMTIYRIPQNECYDSIKEDAFDKDTIYKNDKNKTRLVKADDGYGVVNDKSEFVGVVNAKDDKEAISKFDKNSIEEPKE